MKPKPNRPAKAACLLAVVAVLAIGVTFAASCEEKKPGAAGAASRPADKTYTVRGRIAMLPVPGRPTTDLVIQHEAIDDFINPDGTRGMASMEMPMPAEPDVSLKGLAVGDPVEFDLGVWYKPGFKGVDGYRITRMKPLPPDTKLKFGPATHTLGQ